MKIQHSELNGRGGMAYCASVWVPGGNDNEILEVYRGDTLAYTISSIKWGAGYRLKELSNGGFKFQKIHKSDR